MSLKQIPFGGAAASDVPAHNTSTTAHADIRSALADKADADLVALALASKADLVGGLVPVSQIPGSFDDVVFFDTLDDFPAVGADGRLYIEKEYNTQHRWSGSAYVQMVASPGSTDAVPEGGSNLYFLASRVRDTILTGLSTASALAASATDSVLTAIGKLQAQITALGASKANASDVTSSLAGKLDKPGAFSTLATATLASSNDGGRYNPSATGNTYTIPTGLTGSDGATLNFCCIFSNPGTVIISPASGVTLNGGTAALTCTATATKNMVGIIQTAANTFTVQGV